MREHPAVIKLENLDVGLHLFLRLAKRRMIVLLQQGEGVFKVRIGECRPACIEAYCLHEVIHGLLIIGGRSRRQLIYPSEIEMRARVIGANRDGILQILAGFFEEVVFKREDAVIALYFTD